MNILTKIILFTLWISTYANICTEDTFYVNNLDNLNALENCTIIDGNLIINSGYNIDNFSPLMNLENITGYLVIIDNHNISSLYGLNNLKQINGNELYLNSYSVVIKYNINEKNDSHEGLCYANNIIWNNITTNIDIRNNGINCPECHEECLGCWGPGPRSCQYCRNFEYDGVCVPHCPGDYYNNICDPILPSPPLIDGNIFNLNNILVNWTKSNPNDFISGYRIWLDNTSHYVYLNSDLGYYYTLLSNQYIFNDLNYNTEYIIQVSLINQIGESDRSSPLILSTELEPTTTQTTTPTTTPTTISTTTTITTTTTSTITKTTTTTKTTISISTTTRTTKTSYFITKTPLIISTQSTHPSTITSSVSTTNDLNHTLFVSDQPESNYWKDYYYYLIIGILFIFIILLMILTYNKYNKIDPSISRCDTDSNLSYSDSDSNSDSNNDFYNTVNNNSDDYNSLRRDRVLRIQTNNTYDTYETTVTC